MSTVEPAARYQRLSVPPRGAGAPVTAQDTKSDITFITINTYKPRDLMRHAP